MGSFFCHDTRIQETSQHAKGNDDNELFSNVGNRSNGKRVTITGTIDGARISDTSELNQRTKTGQQDAFPT